MTLTKLWAPASHLGVKPLQLRISLDKMCLKISHIFNRPDFPPKKKSTAGSFPVVWKNFNSGNVLPCCFLELPHMWKHRNLWSTKALNHGRISHFLMFHVDILPGQVANQWLAWDSKSQGNHPRPQRRRCDRRWSRRLRIRLSKASLEPEGVHMGNVYIDHDMVSMDPFDPATCSKHEANTPCSNIEYLNLNNYVVERGKYNRNKYITIYAPFNCRIKSFTWSWHMHNK